jgi:hypothetical protein
MADQNSITAAVEANREGYNRRMETVKSVLLARELEVNNIPKFLKQTI